MVTTTNWPPGAMEMKYTWMNFNVLDSFTNFTQHIQNMLNLFGSKYDINFG
jgi:hypothetical protein